MFAVKGWSVDASALKAQKEVLGANGAPAESKKSKKRKRRGDDNVSQSQIEANDIGSLWDQHIEGKAPVKKEESAKRQKSHATSANATAISENGGEARKKAKAGESAEQPEEKDAKASAGDKEKRSRKDKKKAAKFSDGIANGVEGAIEDKISAIPEAKITPLPQTAKLTPMQSAMRQKLISARFRHLNETLYTAPSNTAQKLFNQNPDMFEDYHAGFRQQVSVWPQNPLDSFLETIRKRGKVRATYNPRDRKPKSREPPGSTAALPRTHGTSIIADLGCGDARLAQTLKLSGDMSKLNLKLHSYDLHSPSPFVTKADISNLPLEDGSVDIAIFCLALMGTNWISFIEEAYRILHWKGELWIAEIKSRFGRVGRGGKPVEHSVGNKKKLVAMKQAKERKELAAQEVNEQEALQTEVDGVETAKEETDVSAFIDVLRRRGFVLKDGEASVDLDNKMFVKMEFIKAAKPTKGKNVQEETEETPNPKAKPKLKFLNEGNEDPATDDEGKVLKPCLYKIR